MHTYVSNMLPNANHGGCPHWNADMAAIFIFNIENPI